MNTVPQSTYSLSQTLAQLARETEEAQKIVYELDSQTPVNRLDLGNNVVVHAKREDQSAVHSYKWRGAYFKMRELLNEGNQGPFVAASAGNHAQGVAAAARRLNVVADIFMPMTTPLLKQKAVKKIGGEYVNIHMIGDNFDEAASEARKHETRFGSVMLQPFDDLSVIAGQATVGLELGSQIPDVTKVYVPVGGGGLASGIAFALKISLGKSCQVFGVEVENQNSMQISIQSGRRIELRHVDAFCDGTAVRKPGENTFRLCESLLDGMITVSNSQVCAAMQSAWNSGRFVPEPSGAIGLAAAIANAQSDQGQTVATVITGGNMDFKTLPSVVAQCNSDLPCRRYYQFKIQEANGTLIRLLDSFPESVNIVDFQYGKSNSDVAYPVLGVESEIEELDQLEDHFLKHQILVKPFQNNAITFHRIIPFHPERCDQAFYLNIDFPNRPGALRNLMRRISDKTNICYFNFADSGELVGRALIGFEPLQADSKYGILQELNDLDFKFSNANIEF